MLEHSSGYRKIDTVICAKPIENPTIKIRVSYYGDKGTIYSEVEDFEEGDFEIGEWTIPFQNERGNCVAFGLAESIMQSEYVPLRFYEGEEIIKIKMELY